MLCVHKTFGDGVNRRGGVRGGAMSWSGSFVLPVGTFRGLTVWDRLEVGKGGRDGGGSKLGSGTSRVIENRKDDV